MAGPVGPLRAVPVKIPVLRIEAKDDNIDAATWVGLALGADYCWCAGEFDGRIFSTRAHFVLVPVVAVQVHMIQSARAVNPEHIQSTFAPSGYRWRLRKAEVSEKR